MGFPGRESEHALRFIPHQIRDDVRADDAGLLRRGLNDDFHRLQSSARVAPASFFTTSALNASM